MKIHNNEQEGGNKMNEKTIDMKVTIFMTILVIMLVFAIGMINISFANNTNTFTFSNDGIVVSDESGSGYKIEGTSLTINESGTYTITGSCSEGNIKVKKETTGVTLVLKNLTLSSSTTAPISLNKSTDTTIEVVGTVNLTDNEDVAQEDTSEDFEGACIKVKSGATLSIKGTGTLNVDGTACKNGIKGAATSKITVDGNVTFNIKAANNGLAADGSMILNSGTFNVEAEDAIKCDPDDDDTESLGDLTINGGTYNIKASSDGIRANGKLEINNGTFDITAGEGLEATYVLINDGKFVINSSDDGINASNKSTRYSVKTEINGGDITINMGRGDTDAIDSNGDLVINGGTLNITGQSAFDYEKKAELNGGKVIVNGSEVTSISNQFMGRGNFGGQNGNQGQMMRPGMDGQNANDMFQKGMKGQNGGRMVPPEMNGQDMGQMMPPEMNGQGKDKMMFNGNRQSNNLGKMSDWATEGVNKASEMQLIPKSFDNTDLTSNITREEFAHIVMRLYEALTNEKYETSKENPFNDTTDIDVIKAYSLGITSGTSSNTFSPKNLITREEMATMMTNAINKAGIDTTVDIGKVSKFSDDSNMHDWGKKPVYFMSSKDIIKGVGNNTFDVNGNATKEQALIISAKTVEKFVK